MDSYTSYQALIKPTWSPPAWIFGPVWTVLYAVIAVTYGTVFYKVFTGALPWKVAVPFALNLVFNFSFTYFQFGLKNNYLASVDILLILGTLVWALVAIYPHLKWVALANVPYLLWVAFATVLQLTVTYLNR
ncbi:MAG: TspO/MBR family protein [Candidatus Paceibacterota bacterium]|jgi:tryptophan-rich sensory protein